MCIFVTVGLNATGVSLERLTANREPLHFNVERNPSVEKLLEPGESYFRSTNRSCDCETPLRAAGARVDPAAELEAKTAKLKKRGWSESRIRRWVAQKEDEAGRKKAALERDLEIASWLALLREWVGGHRRSIALLVHMYSGNLDEPIALAQEQVPLASVNEAWLLELRQDVLYRVVPEAEFRPMLA